MTTHRGRELGFVSRVHRLRTLGLGFGSLGVAAVLYLQGAPPVVLAVLALNGLVWPHIAWWLARRAESPARWEMGNLMIDSVLGGVWIALMRFSLLPTVALATMLAVDKMSVGGWRFLVRNVALLVGACAITSAALGFPVALDTPPAVVAACIPFLVAYPLAISAVMYSLGRRVVLQNRALEEQSRTDVLTGLPNRQAWLDEAELELERHRRGGHPAVVLMLDLDRFKSINDRFGHQVGDEVLRGLAATLRTTTRSIDKPARYGGDEFVLLLAETDLSGGREIAQRIRERTHALTLDSAPGLLCTLSVGAAEVAREHSVATWLKLADDALYRAKAGGRDRVELAETQLPLPGGDRQA